MKRQKLLWIAAILSTILFILEIVAYAQTAASVDQTDSAAVIGTGIGLALVMPHLITFGLGVLLEWIALGIKRAGFILAAGILFCVSLFLGIQNFYMLLLPIILAFIGYSKMKNLTK